MVSFSTSSDPKSVVAGSNCSAPKSALLVTGAGVLGKCWTGGVPLGCEVGVFWFGVDGVGAIGVIGGPVTVASASYPGRPNARIACDVDRRHWSSSVLGIEPIRPIGDSAAGLYATAPASVR